MEEGPGKVGSTLGKFYADCGNSFCSIKNMINTHVNVVEGNNPLKFLVGRFYKLDCDVFAAIVP